MNRSNPWAQVPSRAPFVLEPDLLHVQQFNRTAPEKYRIEDRLLPEPFFGPLDAPVVVLLQNPGVSKDDFAHHQKATFARALRQDLALSSERRHFHLLDPTRGPGHVWWTSACRDLLIAHDAVQVASKMLALEYFPYHSRQFAHGHLRLPSQEFTFSLLRDAIARKALIVCMRGHREWLGAVPELGSHKNLIHSNSKRTSHLSRNNLDKFDRLVKALR